MDMMMFMVVTCWQFYHLESKCHVTSIHKCIQYEAFNNKWVVFICVDKNNVHFIKKIHTLMKVGSCWTKLNCFLWLDVMFGQICLEIWKRTYLTLCLHKIIIYWCLKFCFQESMGMRTLRPKKVKEKEKEEKLTSAARSKQYVIIEVRLLIWLYA